MKKKIIFAGVLVMLISVSTAGQGKYLTNNGYIRFYSHTVIEDITAENNKVASVIDASSGEVAIIVTMSAFEFEKKLMQEHFNENYVESEKFPKATFNGTIKNNSEVKYDSKGTYKVTVAGEMTIHGTTLPVSSEGSIVVTSSGIEAYTKFMLNPEDYNIKIPKVVRKNISEKMEITAELKYLPM